MRLIPACALLALCGSAAFSQSADPKPKFDAVDVHPSLPTSVRISRRALHGTRYDAKGLTLLDLISAAYGMDSDKVMGGPSWLELDRFDLVGLVPAKTPMDTVNQMLQSVLTDRFKLSIERENQPLPAYVLTAGKHQGLKEADAAGEPGCKLSLQQSGMQPPDPSGAPVVLNSLTLTIVETCHNIGMARFAEDLRNMPLQNASFRARPVSDQTELKGNWDFTFKYTLDRMGTPAADTVTVFDAMDKQLGLKLTEVTTSQPVIVVKSVNQTPTPTPPEVLAAFPTLPTEFDVAEIKPSEAGSNDNSIILNGQLMMVATRAGGRGTPPLQNGRVNLQGYTLKSLVTLAFDVSNDDALVGLPKFAETERFDVIAKVPGGGPAVDAFSDIDSIRPLLRALLIDRFKIKTHTEERPLPAFVLTATKPKLAKAAPTGRTKYTEGPGPDGKDPRIANPAVSRLVYCQNMTMAQFARMLPNIASTYFRNTTVQDGTGLDGAWDFTLNFSNSLPTNAVGLRGGEASAGNQAAEPTGGLTLFDALGKQLGLKLEAVKRPLPALVIDHIEQKPTEN